MSITVGELRQKLEGVPEDMDVLVSCDHCAHEDLLVDAANVYDDGPEVGPPVFLIEVS